MNTHPASDPKASAVRHPTRRAAAPAVSLAASFGRVRSLTVFAALVLSGLTLATAGACHGSDTLTGPRYTISGTVNGGGHPLTGAAVYVDYQGLSASTDASGHYTISGVAPGTAQVTARASDFDPASTQVTLPPDAANVDFTLRPSH